MKFLSIRDLRSNTAAVRKSLASEGELVLTASGKPIAVLAPVSPDTVEETVMAIRRARFTQALDKAHAAAKEAGLSAFHMEDVDSLIARARGGKKRRIAL
ncbi:MAG: type II toxin-antitoxin system Phd/YefM family antitoxin [Deltaproteobacteria bacterium]|nr:type II toxin-antitoxin system Phd/YefM family antitoxin [Deltaproteobacteria bacterium]